MGVTPIFRTALPIYHATIMRLGAVFETRKKQVPGDLWILLIFQAIGNSEYRKLS